MDGESGFTKLGEEVLAECYSFNVVAARFTGPDGQTFERDVVHHRGAVAVVPMHEDGSVTLVRQFRASLDGDLLELPAGVRDVDGEPDQRTAERELAEEAGLAASSMEPLITIHNAPGMSDERISVFVARELTAVPDDRQGVEEMAMTVERIPMQDALAMIDDGRITDAKTIVGILLLARRSP